jgi:hypothetical protein
MNIFNPEYTPLNEYVAFVNNIANYETMLAVAKNASFTVGISSIDMSNRSYNGFKDSMASVSS